jgi:peptidoglycan/LPS O-acetylase OafA/YrhL
MSNADTTALERLVDRVPRSVRVGLWIAWSVPGVFVAWQRRTGHDVSPLLWIVVAPGAALLGLLALRLVRAFDAPDRRPFDLSRFWQRYIIVTGSCLGFGAWSFFDGNPVTKPYMGAPMFVVGLALVAIAIRHYAKPVRREYLDPPRPERSSADETPQVIAGWSQAARRTNEGRERRTDLAPARDCGALHDWPRSED